MRVVDNEIYYHIQRKDNGLESQLWEVGGHIIIGKEKNRFYRFIEEFSIQNYEDNNLEHLNPMLNHYLKVIRELVFEEVRKDFFSNLPSRQSCLWVIEIDDKNLDYWKDKLKNYNRILKVRLNGKIHKANQSYLDIRTISINKLREEALNYWPGKGVCNIGNELLFEGELDVIEIVE